MNILFMTLIDFDSIEEHNIYTDLLRKFYKEGHSVSIISPTERRKKQPTHFIRVSDKLTILKLQIGNTQKTNIIEKGISTVSIESIFVRGIKKYFANRKFDLIIYSTPPITFYNAIAYVKKRDDAKTYLLLKDIFPQNAVDIGMLSKTGIKGILYRFFRSKEKKLYGISDYIGCMSQANVEYVLNHNSEIKPDRVEVCPNCIEILDKSISNNERKELRIKYNIPPDKKIFIYGGNLGKPQGIDFLIKCLKSQKDNERAFFLIVGDGTEYLKIEKYIEQDRPSHVRLMKRLPKEDYDRMVAACDVGMIFLDHRFTIPNFPSRLLAYMQAEIPILAVTDSNTDIGKIIVDGDMGCWCESNDIEAFTRCVLNIDSLNLSEAGQKAYHYMAQNYDVNNAYKIIIKHFNTEEL